MCWAKEFCEPTYSLVQLIARIGAPSLIIEVRVALARWPRDQDLDWADCRQPSCFSGRRGIAEITVQEGLNILSRRGQREKLSLYTSRDEGFESTARTDRNGRPTALHASRIPSDSPPQPQKISAVRIGGPDGLA